MAEVESMMDTSELAALLNTSEDQIYNRRHRGQLPPAIQVGRKLYWKRVDIQRWLHGQYEGYDMPQVAGLPNCLFLPKKLLDHPVLHAIAEATGLPLGEVMLQIIRVWTWVNEFTDRGFAKGISLAAITQLVPGAKINFLREAVNFELISVSQDGLRFKHLSQF
jgi:predicted DNA-binding transcriptional regulator AlpA